MGFDLICFLRCLESTSKHSFCSCKWQMSIFGEMDEKPEREREVGLLKMNISCQQQISQGKKD